MDTNEWDRVLSTNLTGALLQSSRGWQVDAGFDVWRKHSSVALYHPLNLKI